MPFFFQFSKNGRKNLTDRVGKKKSYAKANESTMNRICKRFETIGNIRMDYAGIAPFNWQMLLAEPCMRTNQKAVSLFCEMDDENLGNIISGKDMISAEDKAEVFGYDILRDEIIHEMTNKFGSLKAVYPYIVKALFAGDGADKTSHKQMFWRVFGDIAVETLRNNLSSSKTCPLCNMKYPAWTKEHVCPKQMRGFYICVDCGTLCSRSHSRQYRCADCQTAHRKATISARNKKQRRTFC